MMSKVDAKFLKTRTIVKKNKKINNPQMPNVTTPRRLSVALYPVVHEHNWPSTAHVRPQRRTFIG